VSLNQNLIRQNTWRGWNRSPHRNSQPGNYHSAFSGGFLGANLAVGDIVIAYNTFTGILVEVQNLRSRVQHGRLKEWVSSTNLRKVTAEEAKAFNKKKRCR
jgi:hypothetical protein